MTLRAFTERPTANITHAGIVQVLGPIYMRLAIADDQVDPQQYGSVKGKSTVHALIQLLYMWKSALDSTGTMIRILLVDFRKVFDRVDQYTLLSKCASLGLPIFLIKWLTSFLCQRKQRVNSEIVWYKYGLLCRYIERVWRKTRLSQYSK